MNSSLAQWKTIPPRAATERRRGKKIRNTKLISNNRTLSAAGLNRSGCKSRRKKGTHPGNSVHFAYIWYFRLSEKAQSNPDVQNFQNPGNRYTKPSSNAATRSGTAYAMDF